MAEASAKTDLAIHLRQLGGFVYAFIRQFLRHEGTQNAAALTYATLLSLVPLMTVTLAVFSAFPVADRVYEAIQGFIFQNFVPTSGELIQKYLEEFSSKASKMSGAGFGFLVVVALMMMANIDRALNAIWEVRHERSLLNKFLIYWAVLSLGPLLIGVSFLVTSYVISLPLLSDAATTGAGRYLLRLAPVLISTLTFTMLYLVVPNRRVRLRYALAGGSAAALLFEGAKQAFGLYIRAFPTYEAIYGALATVPIFLVWVYLSWMVVLLGAELTHCLSSHHWGAPAGAEREPGLPGILYLLLALDRAAEDGKGRSVAQLSRLRRDWREVQVEDMLERMHEYDLVQRTSEGRWLLARRLDHLTVHEIVRQSGLALPEAAQADWPSRELADLFEAADGRLADVLARPLAEYRATFAAPGPVSQAPPAG